MAAYDPMSRMTLPALDDTKSIVDFRTAVLPPVRPPPGDFDPRNFRKPVDPISPWMAYFNMIRSGLGAGVLGLPLATSQAGIVLGPMMVIFTGFLILYTHLTLLWCLNEISRQLKIPRVTYRYGFRIALLHGPPVLRCIGRQGPTIVATMMILSQLAICTVFVIFTSDSLRDLLDWSSSEYAMLILLVPYLVLEFLMRSLKIVSYVSVIGTILNLIGLAIVFILLIKDPRGDVTLVTTKAMPLLVAFGTCLFNLSAIGVVLSVDKGLQRPHIMVKRFGVLDLGIMVPTLLYTIFGAMGYWAYGSMDENILRSLAFDDGTAMMAIGIYLVAVALAYPIQCYPAMQVVLDIIGNMELDDSLSERTLKLIDTFSRPIFVLLSFFVCYLAPHQGPFVAFVGCLCTSQLCIVFPALMELCLKYPDDFGAMNFHLWKNILLVMLGMFTFVTGVYLCGKLLFIRIIHAAYGLIGDNEFL